MNKLSFFERLTGSVPVDDRAGTVAELAASHKNFLKTELPEQTEDAQLSIDMYQNPAEIIIQAMVAGVRPEDLDVSITQEMVTIKGRRSYQHQVTEDIFTIANCIGAPLPAQCCCRKKLIPKKLRLP